MAFHAPKSTLLHAVLASVSSELTAVDDIIRRPARLPTELLLIVRAHLLSTLTSDLFLASAHALAKYEEILQHLLCPDCISYNRDIYGPDVWQWQQFSGPCNCIQTPLRSLSKLSINPHQFANPHHWLEHHLSFQIAHLTPTSSPSHSIWDVVIDVLHRHHCELLREDLDDFTAIQGMPLSPSTINNFYYRRVIDYHGSLKPRSPPTIRVRPLRSSLRLLESEGIGEVGETGDAYRADIILCQAFKNLGLTLELKDIFSTPREPPTVTPWRLGTDVPMHQSSFLPQYSASSALDGVIRMYSVVSTILAAFVSMPMTIATLALTIVCFYSRPIALRVGV
ncbi:hypothetical protein AN958_06769 [Leucoagaricus sp. SymC.cos]|nr:hypothetical protein AN958_06769 [Leucoagaricus sp. SymC.cos]